MSVKNTWRKRIGMALIILIATMQSAACSEVKINGKTAQDVFQDPHTLALVQAACSGDIVKMDALAKQGVDVNSTGYRDMTPLFWTMDCGNHAGVEKLLKLGANPNYKMEGDISAMWGAAGSSASRLLTLMLAHGGDPNIWAGATSALIISLEQGRDNNFKLLLNYGADINAHDSGGSMTIANVAAGRGRLDVVQMLLDKGYDYDLMGLAIVISRTHVPENNVAQKQHILDMLKDRGVQFPLPQPHKGALPKGF